VEMVREPAAVAEAEVRGLACDLTASMMSWWASVWVVGWAEIIKKLVWVRGFVCRSTQTHCCCLCYIAVHTLFL